MNAKYWKLQLIVMKNPPKKRIWINDNKCFTEQPKAHTMHAMYIYNTSTLNLFVYY